MPRVEYRCTTHGRPADRTVPNSEERCCLVRLMEGRDFKKCRVIGPIVIQTNGKNFIKEHALPRNAFEDNGNQKPEISEEDQKVLEETSHALLPDLGPDEYYEMKKLPSGRQAIVVRKNPTHAEGFDQYGRHIAE